MKLTGRNIFLIYTLIAFIIGSIEIYKHIKQFVLWLIS